MLGYSDYSIDRVLLEIVKRLLIFDKVHNLLEVLLQMGLSFLDYCVRMLAVLGELMSDLQSIY